MKAKVIDLVFDRTIYPREKVNSATVKAYKMAIDAGAEFPPIEIQCVSNYGENKKEVLIITDGVHRWEAFGGEKAKVGVEIEVEYWQDETLDYEASWLELNLRSLELAKIQGKNLVATDKKVQCERLAEADEEVTITDEEFGEWFVVPRRTINDWTGPIRDRQKAGRNAVILRLDLLGWTQEEIAEAVGLADKSSISKMLQNGEIAKTQHLLEEGKSVEDIAEFQKYEHILVWAIKLRDMSDQELAEAVAKDGSLEKQLDFKVLPYDYWYIGKPMSLAGRDHPGRIPGQIVLNTLYFFTERGDMVIDPMAGGGVVPDVCLLMGRHCYAYDIDGRHKRPDILKWDLSEGWPERTKKADLVFFDPPYFDKKDDEYVDGSISRFDAKDYLSFLDRSFNELHETVNKGTRLAFLMSDWNDHDDPSQNMFIWQYANMIEEAGWEIIRRVACPLTTESIHGDFVNKYRESKKLGRLTRDLLVAKA